MITNKKFINLMLFIIKMDPQIADLIKFGLGCATLTGSIYFIHKVANMYIHYRDYNKMIDSIKVIIDNPNYKEHLSKRENIAKYLLDKDPKFLEEITKDPNILEEVINSVVGDLKIEL